MHRPDVARQVEAALIVRGEGVDPATLWRLLDEITDALMIDSAYVEAVTYARQHQAGLDVVVTIVDDRVKAALANRLD